jgi:tRNA modification GTPase
MTEQNYDNQTIIAQCTPRGAGAISLLRVSGTDSIVIVDKISKLASGKSLQELPTHTIHVGYVVAPDDTHIDQVLFLLMRGPRTFTSENTIEITCHNNPFIIADIITLATKAGARLANNGEFTRRAVLHNKIDLLQAEAINELIHAHTTVALKHSLAQLEGSLSSWVTGLEDKLLHAQALCQASFEFLDDEISFDSHIKNIVEEVHNDIQRLCHTFDRQQQIRNGIRIAIIGSVNAGKSSLFNALLGKERAIVTNIPGTTRDTIEAGIYQEGNYWTLIDTAGIRDTHDIIEQQGIERSLHEGAQADIIILVVDGSRPLHCEEKEFYTRCMNTYQDKILLVRNKIDIHDTGTQPFERETINCSCTQGYNIEAVERAIKAKVTTLFESIQSPYLLNERHMHLLMALEKKLTTIMTMLNEPIAYELILAHLTDALSCISELTGKTISERSMDLVFKQFCVGK